MDSITHIVLGATIGELVAGRRLGKKAMLLGAIAQSLPDIDFVASLWLDTSRDVLAHRGITHSFLFVLLVAPLLALAARRKWRNAPLSGKDWILFFGLQLFVHILLDACNAYGTGWFEPFSHYRVSFQLLFVADPFYSVWPGIAFVALLILKKDSASRKYWARFGLIASSLYLCYCVTNKLRIDAQVRHELENRDLAYTRYFATPAPLNNWLWYVVAENQTGYLIGYRSLFDRHSRIDFHYFPKNDSLLNGLRGNDDVRNLLKFAQGYYTVDRWEDGTLVFNDLRFEQMKGWQDPDARFVFHYFLERPRDNAVIVQRGRFAGWDWATIRAFVRRIRGW
jgi:inner membrane protein